MKFKGFQATLKELDLSQNQFARITGFPRERISKWRHNERGVPSWVPAWIYLFTRLPQEEQDRLRAFRGESQELLALR